MNRKKLQIGVMGSMADLNYTDNLEKLAEDIGFWIAKNDAILFFGAEKDADSLSTAACRGAKKAAGISVGVTYGKSTEGVYEKDADILIASGMERGGGREFVLVSSCDAIIAINGGSGTLTEIAIAYQNNTPIIVLENSGGWAQKLAGEFLDGRKRVKAIPAKDAQEAVDLAIIAAKSKQHSTSIL